MNISNFSTLLLLGVACALGAAGCKKTPKSPTPLWSQRAQAPRADGNPSGPEVPGAAIPSDNGATRAMPIPGGADGQNALPDREELGNYFLDRDMFKQQTVYFDFDRFNVKPGEISKIQSVASYLKDQSPSIKILVEGHCDERGTPEYNRALGERRALSIRENLIAAGVSGDRIQTLSYGEDKPADSAHDESAWAKNRRGEFILMTPKAGASELR